MKMTENKLNCYLQSAITHARVHGTCVRVENSAALGMPDIKATRDGIDAWIESKLVLPRGVLLRPIQYAQGTRMSNAGNRVFVVAALGNVLYIWRYPSRGSVLLVSKVGKYLRIDDVPGATFFRSDSEPIVNFLFTC